VPIGVPYNATFAFNKLTALVTSVQVETPVAEIVDMTGVGDATGHTVQVATGAITGGAVTIDYIHDGAGADPQTVIGTTGTLVFISSAYSVRRQAILESASVTAQTADVVRGQLKFRMTDSTV
jgi:hypothetical protein